MYLIMIVFCVCIAFPTRSMKYYITKILIFQKESIVETSTKDTYFISKTKRTVMLVRKINTGNLKKINTLLKSPEVPYMTSRTSRCQNIKIL